MNKQSGNEPRAYIDDVPVWCAYDAIVPVSQMKPNSKNPNRHPDNQIQLLGRIIRQAGWRQPITVSTLSGLIVKGHGRLAAALLEGFTSVPVEYQHYESLAAEEADLVADNRIAELAEIDNRMLADIFAEIDTGEIPLELTGFTEEEVESLISSMDEALHDDKADPDEVPETPELEQVITKNGDLWILGRHRVMCGDSTDREAVAQLMDGQRADVCFTSPPYNAMSGFHANEKMSDKYMREGGVYESYADSLTDEEYSEFLTAALSVALEHSDDTLLNIGYTKGALKGTALFLGGNADKFAGGIAWIKNNAFVPTFPVQHGILTNVCEPIYIFNARGQRKFKHPQWERTESMKNLIQTENAAGNEYSDIHGATFPVSFVEEVINKFTEDSVLDLFGGTGTTLIAAESTGRASYLMELDPRYVDVIVRRYIKATGKADVRLIRKGNELGRENFEGMFSE